MSTTRRTMLRSLAATAAFSLIAAGSASPATAQAPALPDVSSLIPGVTSLPDIPGVGSTAGGNIDPTNLAGAVSSGLGTAADAAGQVIPGAGGLTPPDEAGAKESTNPECAPLMLVAVPATGGISPDWDPNRPVGLINSLVSPLRAELGDKLSETYINYPADLAIKGTSYRKSVEYGVSKAIATIEDAQARCSDSKVILAGFSQGAEVSGDVATLIGNKQTSIDPDFIASVLLFSDPKRADGAPVLPDTSSDTPKMPAEVSKAVGKMAEDPSLAQLQMTASDIGGLASILSGDDTSDKKNSKADSSGSKNSSSSTSTTSSAPPNESSTSSSSAPSSTSSSEENSESDNGALEGLSGLLGGGSTENLNSAPATRTVSIERIADQKPDTKQLGSREKLYTMGVFGKTKWNELGERCSGEAADKALEEASKDRSAEDKKLTVADMQDCLKDIYPEESADYEVKMVSDDDQKLLQENFDKCEDLNAEACLALSREYKYVEGDEARDGARGVIHKGNLNANPPVPPVIVTMNSDKMDDVTIGDDEVWANKENEKTARAQLSAYAAITATSGTDQYIVPSTVDRTMFSEFLGKTYRYGRCGEDTYSECAKKFDTTAGPAALLALSRAVPDPAPAEIEEMRQAIPEGNLAETACADKSAADCAATGAGENPEVKTLPDAQIQQVAETTEMETPDSESASDEKEESANDSDTSAAGEPTDANESTDESTADDTGAADDKATADAENKCSTVAHIGDSLSDPIRDELTKAYTDAGADKVVINANGGRAFAWAGGGKSDPGNGMEAIEAVKKELGADAADACWVLALGTNDATAGADDNATVKKALGAIDEKATIFWPYVYSRGAGILPADKVNSFNTAVYDAAEKDTRVIPVRWANGQEDAKYLGSDGIHHSAEGKAAYVAALGEAVAEGKVNGEASAEESAEEDSSAADSSSETPSESSSSSNSSSAASEDSSTSDTESETSSESSTDASSAASEENEESESSSEETTSGLGGLLDSEDSDDEESSGNSLSDAYAQTSDDDEDSDESTEASTEKKADDEAVPGLKPVTAKPAPGGGLTGQRDQDFGELAGTVASFCAPGDIFCDLPEDSQLARDLAAIGTSVKLPGGIGQVLEGDERMIGVMAIEAVNYVAELTGLPETKLSPESMNTLVRLAAGMTMVAAGGGLAAGGMAATAAAPALAAGGGAITSAAGPAGTAVGAIAGAGIPMVAGAASTVSAPLISQGMKLLTEAAAELPNVLPEVAAQIQDLPAILAALPQAPEELLKNTGADQLVGHLAQGFTGAGLGDITQVLSMPLSSQSLLQSLATDNGGLLELATNPKYWVNIGHSEVGFRGLQVNDEQSSWNWSQDWINVLGGVIHGEVAVDVKTGEEDSSEESSSETSTSDETSSSATSEPKDSESSSETSSKSSEPSESSSPSSSSEPISESNKPSLGDPLAGLPQA